MHCLQPLFCYTLTALLLDHHVDQERLQAVTRHLAILSATSADIKPLLGLAQHKACTLHTETPKFLSQSLSQLRVCMAATFGGASLQIWQPSESRSRAQQAKLNDMLQRSGQDSLRSGLHLKLQLMNREFPDCYPVIEFRSEQTLRDFRTASKGDGHVSMPSRA